MLGYEISVSRPAYRKALLTQGLTEHLIATLYYKQAVAEIFKQ